MFTRRKTRTSTTECNNDELVYYNDDRWTQVARGRVPIGYRSIYFNNVQYIHFIHRDESVSRGKLVWRIKIRRKQSRASSGRISILCSGFYNSIFWTTHTYVRFSFDRNASNLRQSEYNNMCIQWFLLLHLKRGNVAAIINIMLYSSRFVKNLSR